MPHESPAAIAIALYQTAATSALTIWDSARGRLTPELCDQRLEHWSRRLVDSARVQLDISGTERLPRDRACVLMSNHQSHFDIPIIYRAFPQRLRMVAKAELFRIPLFGKALVESGFVSVNRSGDRTQATEAMKQAAAALHSGTSIWLAPEGTRSPDGTLGAFKKGGFLLAITSGSPIVPLVIDGSRHILPKHSKFIHQNVRVRVVFGPPIETAGHSVDALMAVVRAFMTAELEQH